jgi:hypothetical protein
VKSTVKFALLCGAFMVLAVVLASPLIGVPGVSRLRDAGILVSGAVFAVPVCLGPYLGSRKGWVTTRLSMGRCLLAALPLPFLPITFFIGMAGWGDPQEHLIRGMLHAIHRELPGDIVGTLIVTGIVMIGAVAMGSLIWISVSTLTKKWRGRTLLILWTGCALLSGLFWTALLAVNADGASFVTIGMLLVFVSGCLWALAINMNATSRGLSPMFRFSSVAVFAVLAGGGSILFAKSVPEKVFPKLERGPLWTFDIASTGCHPTWGGPDSSAAANEIAFASEDRLGMAFGTEAKPLPGNKWDSRACVFTIDAKSGSEIAQISVAGNQPIINGTQDGNFTVKVSGIWATYTPDLTQVGEAQGEEEPAERWTAARWHNFRSDATGKLWFEGDGDGSARLLLQYPCGGVFIHPLGQERVLVTGCGQFSLFRVDGTQVSTETFTRENVNFAAISLDHRRFAIAVYLWGVGDPSYLEEERIVVYDSETGKAIAAVPSEPLPRTQSWTALSPDGTLLAVGAQTTLRLFRLPSANQQ